MNFSDTGAVLTPKSLKMNLIPTNGTISDVDGNLQFYSNGGIINNYTHQLMENGNDIIVPNIYFDPSDNAYSTYEQNNCSPDDRSKGVYYLLQNFLDIIDFPPNSESDTALTSTNLLITKMDMNQNNGLSKVMYKKKLVYGKQNFYVNEIIKYGTVEMYDKARGTGDRFKIFHRLIGVGKKYHVIDVDPYGFPPKNRSDSFQTYSC